MTMVANIQTRALFKFEVKKKGVVTKETDWIPNLVLDSGLDRMFQGVWYNRVCLGIGTSEPEVTQTQLENFLVATTTTISNPVNAVENYLDSYKLTRTTVWRFGEGVAKGLIAEAGIGWNNASLWNRVLIKDSNGNPRPIEVFEDEYLDVTVKIEVYLPFIPDQTFRFLNKQGQVISEHTAKNIQGMFGVQNSCYLGNPINTVRSLVSNGVIVNQRTGINGTYETATGLITPINSRTISVKAAYTLTRGNFEHKALYLQIDTGSSQPSWGWGFMFEIDPPIVKDNTREITHSFLVSVERFTG